MANTGGIGGSRAALDIVLVVPVWGAAYSRLCTDFLLPSLLAEGNLAEPVADASIALAFACPPATRRAIAASPAGRALAAHVEMVFADNAAALSAPGTKYQALIESTKLVLADPRIVPGHTVLMFLNPDVVCGAGLVAGIRQALARGKRAVMVPGVRTRADSMPDALAPYRHGPALDVPAPRLSRLALGHMHPYSAAFLWNGGAYPVHWPSLLWWRMADGSVLMHSFILHPVAIRCPDPLPPDFTAIDGDFVTHAGLRPEDVHIATDGEALVLAEISGAPYAFPEPTGPPSRRRLATFAVRHMDDIHWHLFGQRIVYAMREATASDRPPPPCPELDRIVTYVQAHRGRRRFANRFRRLDRHVIAPLYDLAARLRGL